jgi:hypothetical protein
MNYKGYSIEKIDLQNAQQSNQKTAYCVNSDTQDMDKIGKACGGGNMFRYLKDAKEAINN